jgi:hypothetical protein
MRNKDNIRTTFGISRRTSATRNLLRAIMPLPFTRASAICAVLAALSLVLFFSFSIAFMTNDAIQRCANSDQYLWDNHGTHYCVTETQNMLLWGSAGGFVCLILVGFALSLFKRLSGQRFKSPPD